MTASDSQTDALGFTRPAGSDQIKGGDDAITQNAKAAATQIIALQGRATNLEKRPPTPGPPGPGVNDVALQLVSQRAATAIRSRLDSDGSAVVVVQGDSKAEGVGASTRPKRWLDQLRDLLRAYYDPDAAGDQGVGYVPCMYVGRDFITPHPTLAGTENTDWYFVASGGLGARAVQLATSKSKVTYAATSCRYVRVHYTASSFAFGKFDVYAGSTKVDTIDTTITSSPESRWKDYDLGSVASRVLEFRWVSGSPRVEGATFRTATTGVTVIDAAHAGAITELYLLGDRFSGDTDSDDLNLQAVVGYDPAVVITATGSNDTSPGMDGKGITPDQFGDTLKQLITRISDALPKAAQLFDMASASPGLINGRTDILYPTKSIAFEGAARSAIGLNGGVTITYESSLWWPRAGTTHDQYDPWGFTVDGVHPSDAGHTAIARMVATALGVDLGKAGPQGPPGTVQDTGWRSIGLAWFPGPVDGSAWIRRRGTTVTLQVQLHSTGTSPVTASPTPIMTTLGFSPGGASSTNFHSFSLIGTDTPDLVLANVQVKATKTSQLDVTTKVLASGYTRDSVSWETDQAWPTTLPGSPA